MADTFGLRAFSNLVTEMNARAHETDAEGLARWTIGELAGKIGFECAWYGWARIDAAAVQIHANATLDLPEDYYPFWTSMAEHDLLAARLIREPQAIATYDRRSGPQNDGMTTLSDRYCLDKMATIMNLRAGRLASFYVSSYRVGHGSRAFSTQEQEFLQCAVDQLCRAMKLSTASHDLSRSDGAISILVNESGIGVLGLGSLREQLGDFWPGWKGDLLPEKLRTLMALPGCHILPDQGIVVTCEKAPDYRNMGLRKLTIRRITALDHLTAREREIAQLLAKGNSHKDVARIARPRALDSAQPDPVDLRKGRHRQPRGTGVAVSSAANRPRQSRSPFGTATGPLGSAWRFRNGTAIARHRRRALPHDHPSVTEKAPGCALPRRHHLLVDRAEQRSAVGQRSLHAHAVAELHEAGLCLAGIDQFDAASLRDAGGADLAVVLV